MIYLSSAIEKGDFLLFPFSDFVVENKINIFTSAFFKFIRFKSFES